MPGSVVALVGAQYGSEGKGAIAYELRNEFNVHVRTGAPNAGHTIHHEGKKYAMRQVPCGWTNPDAALIIGPGAVVDLRLLREEVDLIEGNGYKVRDRIYLDSMASVLDPIRHHQAEGGVHGFAHQAIGSTGEGVGPCRMARIARNTIPFVAWAKIDLVRDCDVSWLHSHSGFHTSEMLNMMIDDGADVLLEGTQGTGLSLTHGPWPYVTSADTNSGQLCTDAGVSPRMLTNTILVARSHPIRVAGNSGPLKDETTWEELGVAPEYTTVTKKERRVGLWDDDLYHRAVRFNRPAVLALTFVDYNFPNARGKELWQDVLDSSDGNVGSLADELEGLEHRHGTPVVMVGTGPREDGSIAVARRPTQGVSGVAGWSPVWPGHLPL